MAIQVNGRDVVRNYEEIERNLHQLKESLSNAQNYKTFLAANTKRMFDQLKSDYDSKLINEDIWLFYGRKINQFFELINQPITMELYIDEIKLP